MNERIDELVTQARKYARDYVADCKHYGHYMEHNELEVKFEEKFAELIVRECADFIKPLGDWRGGHGEPPMPSTSELAKRLKEHFGVQE